jgi:RNA polymerase sigma factor (sigma-70 family)
VKRPDQELIRGFLEGIPADHATISQWAREVVVHVLNFNPSLQEDAVCDTMFDLLQALRDGRFRGHAMLKTYVQQIARYKCVDIIRSMKRARLCLDRARNEFAVAEDPTEPVDGEREYYLVDRVVSLTDPRCIELWKMICLEGITYKEIARRIGLTEGAVKTRVSRCREKALEIRKTIEK